MIRSYDLERARAGVAQRLASSPIVTSLALDVLPRAERAPQRDRLADDRDPEPRPEHGEREPDATG